MTRKAFQAVVLLSLSIALICLVGAFAARSSSDELVVHEWGTFTSFQDREGKSISRINVDDEPLPKFCHDVFPISAVQVQGKRSKGVNSTREDVTLRLETPVVYFHPPPEAKLPMRLDLRVEFRGGWLTQLYPNALSVIEGSSDGKLPKQPITEKSVSSLEWKSLEIGGKEGGPETTERVWLAPRAVDAANVKTPEGESEKYLFYRGIGHFDSPISIRRESETLTLWSNQASSEKIAIDHLWLFDIHEDGSAAFKRLAPIVLNPAGNAPVATVPFFTDEDYLNEFRDEWATSDEPGNILALKGQMREALIAQGLFADEAEAMLNTWELSYFKSWGMRLFYILPQEWTDSTLPMEISVPSKMTRVMVGRIEMLQPAHEALAASIVAMMSDPAVARSPEAADCIRHMHDKLGRFADAILQRESQWNSSSIQENVPTVFGSQAR